MGDPRGHWEGNTLVVETTNFTNKTAIGINGNGTFNSEALRLVERFTPVSPAVVEWKVTVEDPATWTRPWTFALNLTRDDTQGVFEYACHEGNYAMHNILSARARKNGQGAERAPAANCGPAAVWPPLHQRRRVIAQGGAGPSATACGALVVATGFPIRPRSSGRRRSHRRPTRRAWRRPLCTADAGVARALSRDGPHRRSRRRGGPALRDQFQAPPADELYRRFFFEGGGGSNGNVGNAFGTLQGRQPTVALALGYAVVSQDSGHDNQANNDPARGGSQTFGFDPQARLDFGYNSYDQVATTAKAIIALYYGRAAEKSVLRRLLGRRPRRHDAVAAFSGAVRRHPGLLARFRPSRGLPWPRRGTARRSPRSLAVISSTT